MGRIVAVENVSLDGVMQSPASADEDPRDGFTAGGWAARYFERDPAAAGHAMSGPPAAGMLFGRRTYDQLVGHWLSTSDPNPFSDVIRDASKHVVSRSADTTLPHPNSHLVTGDVAVGVRELRDATDGDLVVLGSGDLLQTLFADELVDGLVLTVIPVVLGSGRRLFGDTPLDLEPENTIVAAGGATIGTYRIR